MNMLDHDIGEIVEGYEEETFRVVPVEKYQENMALTTIVQRVSGGKFKRMIDVEVPIWQAAKEYAQECFYNSGATPGVLAYDVIAQEYPKTGVVCFVFAAQIPGFLKPQYVVAPFKLTRDQIAELAVTGKWEVTAIPKH